MARKASGDRSTPDDGDSRFGEKTLGAGFFGLISGLIAGIALFDRGPGIEPLVIALAITGAFVAVIAEARTRRGRGRP